MPWESFSEGRSVEVAGVSVALADACAGLVFSAGTNWVQSNPGVILGGTQVWAVFGGFFKGSAHSRVCI